MLPSTLQELGVLERSLSLHPILFNNKIEVRAITLKKNAMSDGCMTSEIKVTLSGGQPPTPGHGDTQTTQLLSR